MLVYRIRIILIALFLIDRIRMDNWVVLVTRIRSDYSNSRISSICLRQPVLTGTFRHRVPIGTHPELVIPTSTESDMIFVIYMLGQRILSLVEVLFSLFYYISFFTFEILLTIKTLNLLSFFFF